MTAAIDEVVPTAERFLAQALLLPTGSTSTYDVGLGVCEVSEDDIAAFARALLTLVLPEAAHELSSRLLVDELLREEAGMSIERARLLDAAAASAGVGLPARHTPTLPAAAGTTLEDVVAYRTQQRTMAEIARESAEKA